MFLASYILRPEKVTLLVNFFLIDSWWAKGWMDYCCFVSI